MSDLEWITSSYSGAQGGDCVEVADGTSMIHVRASKNPKVPRWSSLANPG